jgi:hypothetical protein
MPSHRPPKMMIKLQGQETNWSTFKQTKGHSATNSEQASKSITDITEARCASRNLVSITEGLPPHGLESAPRRCTAAADGFGKIRKHVMGSFGSGRPSGFGRDTVEACRSIDVNRLHKTGCLRSGYAGGWQWTRDGEKVASINLRVEADRLHLSYRYRFAGGDWEDVNETVRIVRLPCRFGGSRRRFGRHRASQHHPHWHTLFDCKDLSAHWAIVWPTEPSEVAEAGAVKPMAAAAMVRIRVFMVISFEGFSRGARSPFDVREDDRLRRQGMCIPLHAETERTRLALGCAAAPVDPRYFLR